METTAALSELERVQTRILQRISDLELLAGVTKSPSTTTTTAITTSEANPSGNTTEARLSSMLLENGVKDFEFKRVSFDYYDWSLESRRDVLGAASIHHLCKSIVLVPLFTHLLFFVYSRTFPKTKKYHFRTSLK